MMRRLLVAMVFATGCGSRTDIEIVLPAATAEERSLLLAVEHGTTKHVVAYDLVATPEPAFAFEVGDDSRLSAGYFEDDLATLRIPAGAVDLRLEGVPLPEGRFLSEHLDEGALQGWQETTDQLGPLADVRRPAPDKLCRKVEIERRIPFGHIEPTTLALIDPDTVLVSGSGGAYYEVHRDGRVEEPAELQDGPASGHLWRDDEGRFWGLDGDGRLSRIERRGGGYVWTDVITSTAAYGHPLHMAGGRDANGELEIVAITEDDVLLWTTETLGRWRTHPVALSTTESKWRADVAWDGPGRAIVATATERPLVATFEEQGVRDDFIRVEGPNDPELVRTFGAANLDGRTFLAATGAIFTYFLELDVRTARIHGDTVLFDFPVVEIAMLDADTYLYATKGSGIGIHASDGCREPVTLPTDDLRSLTVIDDTSAVMVSHSIFWTSPAEVVFVQFVLAPPSRDAQ